MLGRMGVQALAGQGRDSGEVLTVGAWARVRQRHRQRTVNGGGSRTMYIWFVP